MDDWAQIRYLRKQGLSIRKIAAKVGCAKKTVERALASDEPPVPAPGTVFTGVFRRAGKQGGREMAGAPRGGE